MKIEWMNGQTDGQTDRYKLEEKQRIFPFRITAQTTTLPRLVDCYMSYIFSSTLSKCVHADKIP